MMILAVLCAAAVLVMPCTAVPMTELTSANWNDVAMDPSKHVFVQFYTPWCGQCRQMAGAWAQVADLVRYDDVVIGRMDASKARALTDELGVEGFPEMLFLHRAHKGKPVLYQGGRSASAMFTWFNGQIKPPPTDDDG